MIAAMGGEVDFVASILTIEDFPVLTRNADAGNYEVRLWQKRAGAGVNYFFRQSYTPDPVMEGLLRDKRFRRALSLAINRAEINELLYFRPRHSVTGGGAARVDLPRARALPARRPVRSGRGQPHPRRAGPGDGRQRHPPPSRTARNCS